jgi:hypothetical protein
MLIKLLKKLIVVTLNFLFYSNKDQNEEFVYHFFVYLNEFKYSKYTFWEKFFLFPIVLNLINYIQLFGMMSFCRLINFPISLETFEMIFELLNNNIFRIFMLFGYMVHCFLVFKRYTNERKEIYGRLDIELRKFPGSFIQRKAFSTASKFTAAKPFFLACAGCVTGVVTGAAGMEFLTGVNPVREAGLAFAGAQTSQQAMKHITNPFKYTEGISNGIPPFEQDKRWALAEMERNKFKLLEKPVPKVEPIKSKKD